MASELSARFWRRWRSSSPRRRQVHSHCPRRTPGRSNALYHFNTQYVTPYATLGLGIERSGFEVKNPDVLALYPDFSATEFAFNFGGGVKYAVNDRWHLRADLRRFHANDVAPDFWRLYAGLTFKVR